MGSIRTNENIGKLVKLTVSTLQLPASRLNIGAKQYVTSALTLNTAVTGVGGVDATIQPGSLYYCFAVVSSNVVYLIASLNASLPSGFTQARAVGGFVTNSSSQIDQVGEYPGNLAVAGSVSAGTGVVAEDNQNLIINGAFDFWQRGTSFSNPANETFTADRWKVLNTSGAQLNYTQLASNPLTSSFSRFALRMTVSAFTSAQYNGISYTPEGLDAARFYNKVCTLSFWVRSSYVGTFSWGVQGLGSGCVPYHFTINQANTWEYKTLTFLFATPYGVPVTNTTGACVFWWTIIAMSGLKAAPGVWNNTNKMVSTSQTDWPAGSTFDLAEVMFNVGSKPAPFKRAGGTIGGELALCQRYFVKLAGGSGPRCTGYTDSPDTNGAFDIVLPVTTRVAPIANMSAGFYAVGTTGALFNGVTGLSNAAASGWEGHTCSYSLTVPTGNGVFRPMWFKLYNGVSFDAEL